MAIDLQIEGLSKSFGALVLFENISFSVEERQRIGLIARNGKGKSTLLKIIAGGENYDSGSIVFRKDLRVGYLEQEPHFESGLRVIDACLRRNGEVADAISRYERVAAGGDEHELHAAIEEMERLSAWDYETKVKQVLSQLKINDFNQKVETLSGGQMKRVALASVLLEEPDLMILDEPTNHLDMQSKDVLKEAIRDFDGTVIVVSHDRDFLDGLVTKVYEFGDGKVREHLGGIYDYLSTKNAQDINESLASSSKKEPQKEAPAQVSESRLSYEESKQRAKQQRKLMRKVEEDEKAINELESAIAAIEEIMATPEGSADAQNYERYASLKRQLADAMNSWEESMQELETFENQ